MPVIFEETHPTLPALEEEEREAVKSKSLQRRDKMLNEDEDDILKSWQVFTKMKNVVKNGNRFENASWRRWYQKRNGVKVPSFEQPERFRQYTDDTVFKVLGSFEKNLVVQEIIDKNSQEETTPPSSPTSTTSPSSSQKGKSNKTNKSKTKGGLGFHFTDLAEINSWAQEYDRKDDDTDSTDESSTEFSETILSPPTKTITKKKVRFDETLNKTTFVRYSNDTWLTGIYENADEYCRIEMKRRGLILFEKPKLEGEEKEEEEEEEEGKWQEDDLTQGTIKKSTMPSLLEQEKRFTDFEEGRSTVLNILDVTLTLIFEVGSFVQWYRASLFK